MKRRLCSCVVTLLVLTTSLSAQAGKIKANSAAQADEYCRRIQATRFLDFATFGATKPDITALAQRIQELGSVEAACEEWIDQQYALPATYIEPLALQMQADDGIDPLQTDAWVQRYRHHAFAHAAMGAPDQLRQRVTWAASQIAVVSEHAYGSVSADGAGKPYYYAPTNYYDMLMSHAFGNYGAMLKGVSLHPTMGHYLSHVRNRKANAAANIFPDENFAREIMQLFSIGLYELNSDGSLKRDGAGRLIPTYDNEDIRAFARVFTGWKYAGDGFWAAPNFHDQMEMYESEHDVDAKVLLNGTTLPAGQTGMQDLDGAIANLMSHSSTAPFVSRRLIQRLVKSNPSRNYLARVSQVWNNTNGDMKSVIKAILLDSEVVNGISFRKTQEGPGEWYVEVLNNGTEDSRLQEPTIRYFSLLRRFEPESNYPSGRFMMSDMSYHWTQAYMKSPSVFNFYLPDFQPPGEIVSYYAQNTPDNALYAPEYELLTAVTATRILNRYRSTIYNQRSIHTLLNNGTYDFRCDINLNFDDETALASNPRALVDHLDMLLAKGNLSDEVRDLMITALEEETTSNVARARAAILCVKAAPQADVNR